MSTENLNYSHSSEEATTKKGKAAKKPEPPKEATYEPAPGNENWTGDNHIYMKFHKGKPKAGHEGRYEDASIWDLPDNEKPDDSPDQKILTVKIKKQGSMLVNQYCYMSEGKFQACSVSNWADKTKARTTFYTYKAEAAEGGSKKDFEVDGKEQELKEFAQIRPYKGWFFRWYFYIIYGSGDPFVRTEDKPSYDFYDSFGWYDYAW